MTPALKAMVDAMITEVSRQVYTDYTTEDPSPDPFLNDLLVDGRVDLEKVARAGLAAIREPSSEMSTAGKHAIKGAADEVERTQAEVAYKVMIDAILNEKS